MMLLGDLSRVVDGSSAVWLVMCGCLAESKASATRWLAERSAGCECCIARGDTRAGLWLLGLTVAGRWGLHGASCVEDMVSAVDGGVSRQLGICIITAGHLVIMNL